MICNRKNQFLPEILDLLRNFSDSLSVLGKDTVEEFIQKLSIVIRVFARSAEESTQLKHNWPQCRYIYFLNEIEFEECEIWNVFPVQLRIVTQNKTLSGDRGQGQVMSPVSPVTSEKSQTRQGGAGARKLAACTKDRSRVNWDFPRLIWNLFLSFWWFHLAQRNWWIFFEKQIKSLVTFLCSVY